MKKLSIWSIIVPFILLSLWWVGGYFFSQNTLEDETEASIRSKQWYTFISPLLECEANTKVKKQKYIPFEHTTITRITEEVQNKNPDIHLSVYFRNLNNGPWFGINEDEDFSPASLMKLPIMMMYMKWSEVDPGILSKKITVEKNENQIPQSIKPSLSLTIGKEYTIDEILQYLIIYSDNTALTPLLKFIPENFYNQVFLDLGVPLPESGDYTLSVKEYASFYRMLFNASFLWNDASEKALKLLSQSTYTQGIRAGIPAWTLVANKFGERELIENGKVQHQLHDCGIVYAPNYPYLLCIMTKWDTDMTTLATMIEHASYIVYDEIDKRFGK
jgi:beta-lactamase class A